jgi:hypothetical protein
LVDLPEDLHPNSPDEVGSILTYACGETEVGTYVTDSGSAGGSALRSQCVVKIFDMSTGHISFAKTVLGPPPPSKVDGTGSASGRSAYPDEILAALLNVHRSPKTGRPASTQR